MLLRCRLLARASIEIACHGQFRFLSEWRARPTLPWRASGRGKSGQHGALTFERMPPLNQSQPKSPVSGITRRSSKATAFIGAPPELIVSAGPNDFEGEAFVEHGQGLLSEHLEQKRNKSQEETPTMVFDSTSPTSRSSVTSKFESYARHSGLATFGGAPE